MTAPGPAPDRAAAERPGCKYWCDYRDTSHEGPCLPNNTRRIADLEAELDRQRALIAAVLAECSRHENRFRGIRYEPVLETSKIRALLGGEGR